MKELTAHNDIAVPQFQGYTMDELQHRRDVNAVRQALLMEQIKGTAAELRHSQEKSPVLGFVSRMDSLFSIAQYGFLVYTVFSKVKSVFSRFRR